MDLLTTDQSGTSADVELELEYEIEEDIESELENFVRLNHTGQFEDAHELFDECLSSHDHWYPIAAEYADCLLREGKLKQLAQFCSKASTTFQDPGEKMVLLLMGIIGDLGPRDVMRQQLQDLRPIDGLKPPYTSLRDTDIHILELVLLALVLTQSEPKDLEASLTSDGSFIGPWSVFKDWFYYLLDNQSFWEAQRILQSLLHVVSLLESQHMVRDYIEKAVSTNIGEESVQIAVSSLVQRFIYVIKSKRSSPLAAVPWNDAITWALLGVTLVKKGDDSTSLFKCIFLRRSLVEELAPGLGIILPLNGVQGNDGISDSICKAARDGDVTMMRQVVIDSPTRYRLDEMISVALLEAAQRPSKRKVLEFLDSKTVHTRDGYQRTALHWAALNHDWLLIEILLKQGGADPDSLDWFGCTPLHYVVKTSSGEQLKAAYSLLDFNAATVNTRDLSGLGPLHTAILDDSRSIATLLVQYGAIMETSDIGALPPFDFGNVDWDFDDVRASTTSGLTSPKNPLAFFHPSDLTLTGAKHGTLSKRPLSSMDNRAVFTRSHSRETSSSDQFGPRTIRSHLLAGLRSVPRLPEPDPSTVLHGQHPRQLYPPTKTPDQNPPCNTLFVGNLPNDTSEDELKDLFSKQKGYKRLRFVTKQNGPMCFVEFEDVSFATKALQELYGHSLQNSTEGGIRLSFAKNPLGVRAVSFETADPSEILAKPFDSASDPRPGQWGSSPGLSRISLAPTITHSWNHNSIPHGAVTSPLRTPLRASEMHQSSRSDPA